MPRSRLNVAPLPKDFAALVQAYPPAAIHDEVAYENTMELIDQLTSLPRATKGQLKYLDTLTILVERYEDDAEGVSPPCGDALSTLRLLVDAHGMSASDLGRLLGDRSLGTRLLNGRRDLSKSHIKTLAAHFHVSPAVLFD